MASPRCDRCGKRMRAITPVFIRMVRDPLPSEPEHNTVECAEVCTSCAEVVKTNAALDMPPIFKSGFKWPDAVGLPAVLGLGSPFAA